MDNLFILIMLFLCVGQFIPGMNKRKCLIDFIKQKSLLFLCLPEVW